ncbi:MAG: homoserine kinase [Chloroflexi bacterium]|nr:homoserine kinase [Chloroflexota bacterium]
MPSTQAEAAIAVRAPATSANLGPGFDCLGLALDLWSEVVARPGRPTEGTALISRAVQAVFDRVGAPPPELSFECVNRIPFSRGLGSSAAAIVSGLLIGNRLLDDRFCQDELLGLAAELERHPDNVTPCLLGGVRVVTVDSSRRVLQSAVPLAHPLSTAVFVPDLEVPTVLARTVLPSSVPLADALFNVGRATMLVAALASGRDELLRPATEDRLHQPYRTPLFPALPALVASALEAGALGAYSSGGGPAVLALCADAQRAATVCAAFDATASRLEVAGSTLSLAVSDRGAEVVHGD